MINRLIQRIRMFFISTFLYKRLLQRRLDELAEQEKKVIHE